MNKTIKLMIITHSIFVIGANLLGPLYAVYISNISNKITAVSYSWTAMFLGKIIFLILAYFFSNKIKNYKTLWAYSYVIRSLVWFGYAFTGSFAVIIVLQIALGFGNGLGGISYSSLFAKNIDKGKTLEEYAVQNLTFSLATAISTSIGGLIAHNLGFRILFLIMSSIAILACILTITKFNKVEKELKRNRLT